MLLGTSVARALREKHSEFLVVEADEFGETEETSFFVLRIDMYVEGTLDLLELIIMHPFLKPDDQQKEGVNMAQKAIIRYFPVFEKVLRDHGQRVLVGNQLSLADVILLQTILALEEKIPNILSAFPHLQEFTVKISNIPTIKKFLEPGSKKKPPPDDIYVRTVYNIFMP